MERLLLIVIAVFFKYYGLHAQAFVPGNLVVSRYGDGIAALPDDQRTVPVFIDEYDPSGNRVRSIAMPVEVDESSGNRILTGGTRFREGLITLSPNGQFLTLIGYHTAPYGAEYSITTQRTIGVVTADGVINTTTAVRANVGNPRCAITHNGASIWFVGSGAGLKHKAVGTIARNDSVILRPPDNYNSVYIFNRQLYYTTNSAEGPKIAMAGSGLTYGEGEVAAGTSLPGNPDTRSPGQMVMLDSDTSTPEPDLLYITDSRDGSLKKWVFEDGAWLSKGEVAVEGTTDGLSGVTGEIRSGDVTLYAVNENSLLAFRDPAAILSNFSSATHAPVVLARAPGRTLFKGVAFAPGTVEKIVAEDVSSREFASLIQENTDLITEVRSNETYQRYPGVEETNISYISNRGVPVALFFLKVNLSNPNVTIETATPFDKPDYARQTIRDMIPYKNAADARRQVIAASNGDYYSWTGEPDGAVHKNGVVIKTSPPKKFFFGILNDGTALVGDKRIYDGNAARLKEAVGGRFLLMNYGETMTEHLKDISIEPRTTVGVLSPDRVVFMWVDGRRIGHSAGLSLRDIAKIYDAIGATDALNMDGGGSTTFLMRRTDGSYETRNKPSDNAERANANGVMVMMDSDILRRGPRQVEHAPEAFAVYPNPVGDHITLEIPAAMDSGDVALTVVDRNGVTMLTVRGDLASVSEALNRRLPALKAGVYVAKVAGGTRSHTTRFAKK